MSKYEEKLQMDNPSLANAYLPLTFHIVTGLEDTEYLRFLQEFYRRSKVDSRNIWIVKPGEISNQGSGITVCHSLQEIKNIIKNK